MGTHGDEDELPWRQAEMVIRFLRMGGALSYLVAASNLNLLFVFLHFEYYNTMTIYNNFNIIFNITYNNT